MAPMLPLPLKDHITPLSITSLPAITSIDCTFNANVPTSVSHSIQNLDSEGMFIIESAATLSLISCIVSNVHRMSRPLFTLYSGDLFIQKTKFSNISGIARYPQGEYENSLFYIATEAQSSIQINEALFQTITDQLAILSIHPSSSNFCLVVVSDCVFRHNNVRSDYYGHFYAFLLLSNNHFANSIATQGSLFLFSTSYVVIENTIWDDYTVAVSVIVKTQSSDTHNSINNITMKNIHGGCIDIAYASSPVIISNSRFENISYAGNSCILLTARQQYLFRNNRFENCSGWQAAIIVKEPDGVSVFENLTFISNQATSKYFDISQNYADLVLVNPGFPDSDIIVNGTWHIERSRIVNGTGLASSMFFQFGGGNKSTNWTINMHNWVIKDISTYPAIWFDGVNLNIYNLSALNNDGVFIVSSSHPGRITAHSMVSSYFAHNGNTLINQLNFYEWPSSRIVFKNNTFDSNTGDILQILTYNGTVAMEINGKTSCANATHFAFENHCHNQIQISSLQISNITRGIHGSWWGCNDFNCYLKRLELQNLDTTQITFVVDNANSSQYPTVYWRGDNQAVFKDCSSNNFQLQYVFDNVNAYFVRCTLQHELAFANRRRYGMFQAINHAFLEFEQCTFKHNQIPLINASQSSVRISNCTFTNNTGNSFMIYAESSNALVDIDNSLFQSNNHFATIIGVKCSGTSCHAILAHSKFVNGYNTTDYRSHNAVGLSIVNTTFVNGTHSNSIDIMNGGDVVIKDSIWNAYTVTNTIKHYSRTYDNLIFINNTVTNVTGTALIVEGEWTRIVVA
eukprot:884125_1